MENHTRSLFQQALRGLALLLYLGAIAGATTHHDDDLETLGLQVAAAVESGKDQDRGGEPGPPAPDFDCALCLAVNLQVLPGAAAGLDEFSTSSESFTPPCRDTPVHCTPLLARHPRGPPPA